MLLLPGSGLARLGVFIRDACVLIEELLQALAIGLVLGIGADGFAVSFGVGPHRYMEEVFLALLFSAKA